MRVPRRILRAAQEKNRAAVGGAPGKFDLAMERDSEHPVRMASRSAARQAHAHAFRDSRREGPAPVVSSTTPADARRYSVASCNSESPGSSAVGFAQGQDTCGRSRWLVRRRFCTTAPVARAAGRLRRPGATQRRHRTSASRRCSSTFGIESWSTSRPKTGRSALSSTGLQRAHRRSRSHLPMVSCSGRHGMVAPVRPSGIAMQSRGSLAAVLAFAPSLIAERQAAATSVLSPRPGLQ